MLPDLWELWFSDPHPSSYHRCRYWQFHEGRRGLTALFWSNTNRYGTFRLDVERRLDLATAVC